MIGDVPAWAMLVWRWGMNAARASCSNRGTFSIVFRPSYRNMLDFVKVPCNFWEKYTGTCLNTRNERAWHWATSVFKLRYVRFLSVWRRTARHFYGCTHFLSWYKSETNSRTHSYTVTHLGTHIHAQAYGHTGHSLSLSLPLSLSLSHTHTLSLSTIHVHLRYTQMAMSVSNFFSALWRPYWFSVLLILTSKRWLIVLSHVFRWSLVPYEVHVQHGCSKKTFQLRGCPSGEVYVPCIYTHARWELP